MSAKLAQSLKARADKVFSDMASQFVDAGEEGNGSPVEREKYYPRLTIPIIEGYDKKPGDKCHILALATVETVKEDEITVKIEKVLDLPAAEEEEEDKKEDADETEEEETAEEEEE